MFKYLFRNRKRYESFIAIVNEDPIKELDTLGFLESWGIRYLMSPYNGITLVPFFSFISQVVLSGDIAKLNSQLLSINPILGEYVVDKIYGKDVFIGELLYNEIIPSTYREDIREYVFSLCGEKLTITVESDEDQDQLHLYVDEKIKCVPILERRRVGEEEGGEISYCYGPHRGDEVITIKESTLFGPLIKKMLGTRI